MAQKVIIKNNITGEEQYPVTSKECVIGLEELVSALNADKTNLANFKQHVEADFVKDTDYNTDKATIMGQIMDLQKRLDALESR